MSESKKKTLIDYLQRHFLTLHWTDRTSGSDVPKHASGFLVEAHGGWFMVTAGHVLEDIETAKSRGQVLEDFALCDCYGAKTTDKTYCMDFDFENAPKLPVHQQETGVDIGVICLRSYDRLRMEKAGNVEPLTENEWCVDPGREATGYCLVGIPAETIGKPKERNENLVTIPVRVLGYPVQRIDDPGLPLRREEPMFYGRLVDDPKNPPVERIEGMSGSPIFGVHQQEPGQVIYWLVALQSYWHAPSRQIRGCLTAGRLSAFQSALADIAKKREAERQG